MKELEGEAASGGRVMRGSTSTMQRKQSGKIREIIASLPLLKLAFSWLGTERIPPLQ